MMKNLLYLAAFVLVLAVSSNASAQKKNEQVVYFKSSMHCKDCENTLFEHLQ